MITNEIAYNIISTLQTREDRTALLVAASLYVYTIIKPLIADQDRKDAKLEAMQLPNERLRDIIAICQYELAEPQEKFTSLRDSVAAFKESVDEIRFSEKVEKHDYETIHANLRLIGSLMQNAASLRSDEISVICARTMMHITPAKFRKQYLMEASKKYKAEQKFIIFFAVFVMAAIFVTAFSTWNIPPK